MCFPPVCHHDSASWHAERSSRWKQCRAVLGWCGLPRLFCTYLIYCTLYFLFPCLSAARHVVLSSASAWPCIWKREQGCPGVWARRTVCSVPLGLGSLKAPQLMDYNISCYLISYSLCFFSPIPWKLLPRAQERNSRTVPEAIKMYLLKDWTFYLWVKMQLLFPFSSWLAQFLISLNYSSYRGSRTSKRDSKKRASFKHLLVWKEKPVSVI